MYESNADYQFIEPHFYILDMTMYCFDECPDISYIEITENLLKVEIREEDDLDVFFLFLKRMIIGLINYDKDKIEPLIKMGLEHKNEFVQEKVGNLLTELDYRSRRN